MDDSVQPQSSSTDTDRHDAGATHFLVRLKDEKGTGVGTVRCYDNTKEDIDIQDEKENNCRVYRVGRLAVLGEHRKYGYGRELMRGVHEWLRKEAIQEGIEFVRVVIFSQVQVV